MVLKTSASLLVTPEPLALPSCTSKCLTPMWRQRCPTHCRAAGGQGSLPFTKVGDVLPGFVPQSPSVCGFSGWMLPPLPVLFLSFLFQNPTYNFLLPKFLLLFKSPVESACQTRATRPFPAPVIWQWLLGLFVCLALWSFPRAQAQPRRAVVEGHHILDKLQTPWTA